MRKFELFMVLCIFAAAFVLARKGAALTAARESQTATPCIVIDAGHGGNDPGKIGVSGTLEKDINLALALRLETLFSNKEYSVVQTRTEDICLASENASSMKREDLRNRVSIISDAAPICTVSIHQNSYSDSSVHGPQVFYYSRSDEGKKLAQALQGRLNESLVPDSPRTTKANDDYYLLKNTPTPTVIVECGFLSNPTEERQLADPLYQDRVVRAIYMGVQDYLSGQNSPDGYSE